MDRIIATFKATITYLDGHQGLLTLALTILGWFVLLWLGLYHSKKSLRNEARLKVYEDLLDVKNKLDKSFSLELATKINTFALERVLNDMENFDSDKKYLITTGIYENSYIYWNLYFRELSKIIGDSHDDVLQYYNRLERWIGVIPGLKKVRDLWFNKTNQLYRRLWDYNQKYMGVPVTDKESNWKEDALKEAEELRGEVDRVTGYTEDLNIMIHDYLLFPIFKYKKKERDLSFMNKDIEYTALTRKGFVQRKYKAKSRLQRCFEWLKNIF